MAIPEELMYKEISKIEKDALREELYQIVKEHFAIKKKGFVNLNEHKGLVAAALDESVKHNLLGSLGDEEASKLVSRLRCEDYCIRYSKEYENLDEFDFENIEMERYEDCDYDI